MLKDIITILHNLHPDVDFEQCENLVDDGILDSLDIVSLVAEMYEVFDVIVPADEIVPENFNSAHAIAEMAERLKDE